VGRRGSLSGRLTVQGKQGHVAYPDLATNPIHQSMAAIDQLTNTQWDQGNEFFPPTSLQVSNINGGTGATNVIPGQLTVEFNLRYSSEVTAQQLVYQVEQIFDQHQLNYDLQWTYNGLPFLTKSGVLVEALSQSIEQVMGYPPQLLTTGGTSDGRFIAPTGAQVVELGPTNATIHQIDECVAIDQISNLTRIYQQLLAKLLL
jgi:succinyl-diaminopimelate desuccinylase